MTGGAGANGDRDAPDGRVQGGERFGRRGLAGRKTSVRVWCECYGLPQWVIAWSGKGEEGSMRAEAEETPVRARGDTAETGPAQGGRIG